MFLLFAYNNKFCSLVAFLHIQIVDIQHCKDIDFLCI